MNNPTSQNDAGATAAALEQIRDYFPETLAVVSALMAAGWAVDAINDGGESDDPADKLNAEQVADAICAVDEARIYVRNTLSGVRGSLLFVLGNSPGELVADGSSAEKHQPMWDVVSKVADAWEGREQPMTTWAARRERSARIEMGEGTERTNRNELRFTLISGFSSSTDCTATVRIEVHQPMGGVIRPQDVPARLELCVNAYEPMLAALKQAEEALAKAQGFRFADPATWYDEGKALDAVRDALKNATK